jgi:DcaP outer membrane protein
MKEIRKTILLVFFVLLCGATEMMAQEGENTQQEAMRKLQSRMDELRAQMAQIQGELDAMHGQNDLSKAVENVKPVPLSVQTGSIERTMPTLTTGIQLTPDQQREAVGKETAAYESFAEESEAVPRLYNAPLEATMPGFFVLPGTQTMMRINGLIKTDVMFDPRPAGLADSFIPSTIPIPQTTSTNNFNASIRESRFSADFRIPVSNIGMARTFIQFDFFGGNGATTPRLRHFYAQLHNVLVGQTNTVFMDPDAWPDIIEFQGPTSGLLARIPQVRYSFPLGKGFSAAVSVEQPSTDVSFSVAGSPAVPITPAPDGGLRVRYESDRGHLYFSSILRELAVHMPVTGQQQSVLGWGLNLSSTWRVVGRDTLNYQVAYGNGIAKYTGDGFGLGMDAQPKSDVDLTLKALPTFAPWVSYQHNWTRSVRSSATFGLLQIQNTAFQPGNAYHKSTYSSANVIWNAVGSLSFGAEFMYGWVEQKNQEKANAPRLQFSGRYTFVKLHPND